MKNQKAPRDEQPSKPVEAVPEPGAESQLHCYNAASWRLAELSDFADEPATPAARPAETCKK